MNKAPTGGGTLLSGGHYSPVNNVRGGTLFTGGGHYSPVNSVRGDIIHGGTVFPPTPVVASSGFLQATPVTSCGHYSGLPPDTRPSNLFPQLAVIWASRLATLQPDATAVSQQVPNTRAHALLPLDHTNTTQITSFFFFFFFFKYVK